MRVMQNACLKFGVALSRDILYGYGKCSSRDLYVIVAGWARNDKRPIRVGSGVRLQLFMPLVNVQPHLALAAANRCGRKHHEAYTV